MVTRTLSEPESKALLAGYGVPWPTSAASTTADAAVAAADAIGFPSSPS